MAASPSRRALFSAAAILATAPAAAMASPLIDQERAHALLFNSFNASRNVTDDEADAFYDRLSVMEEAIASAPCRSLADALAKLRCVALVTNVNGESPHSAEVIAQVVAFLEAI